MLNNAIDILNLKKKFMYCKDANVIETLQSSNIYIYMINLRYFFNYIEPIVLEGVRQGFS